MPYRVTKRDRSRTPRIMSAPGTADDRAAAAAPSSGHAPHIVMLVPRYDMLDTAPNRIDLYADRVVAFVQGEDIRADPPARFQRKRVAVRTHAQADTAAGDVEPAIAVAADAPDPDIAIPIARPRNDLPAEPRDLRSVNSRVNPQCAGACPDRLVNDAHGCAR